MTNAQEIALIGVAKRQGILTPADLSRLQAARHRSPELPLSELLRHERMPTAPLGELHRGLLEARFACACGFTVDYPGLGQLPNLRCPSCGGGLEPVRFQEETRPFRSDHLPAAVHETYRDPERLEQPDPSAARTIGPYQLLRELGRGTMGVVFEATHPDLERRFALKVLLDGADEEAVRRFQREATVASRLNDPGVVGVYDVGCEDGRYYYAMEFVPGRSLRERLKREGALPPREAAALVRELARALDHAHRNEVTHRDLKPANVMLVDDGRGGERPRITDFGLARDHRDLMSSLSRTGDVFGTPLYMSPEQILGLRVDGRADIYALGVIFYECLVNQLPFQHKDWIALAQLIQDGEYTPASQLDASLPAELDAIIGRAMAKDRDERYATAGELEADLAAFLERDAAEAATPRRRPQRAEGGNAWALPLGLGLAALFLVAVLGGLLASRSSSAPELAASPQASPAPAVQAEEELGPLLARAERALESGDLVQLKETLKSATAFAPDAPALLELRRRHTQQLLLKARSAEERERTRAELELLELAGWVAGNDARTWPTVAARFEDRAVALRKLFAPYATVDAFLERGLGLPALPEDRRRKLQLERVRLARARGHLTRVGQLAQPLLGGRGQPAREAELLELLARVPTSNDPRKIVQELERQSQVGGRCGKVAGALLASSRRDQRGIVDAIRFLREQDPAWALGAVVLCDNLLTPLGQREEAERRARAALAAHPDDSELQAALASSLWSGGGRPSQAARSLYARAVELTLPDGKVPTRVWARAAIAHLWTGDGKALLESCQRDGPRLLPSPELDREAVVLTLTSMAHFLLKDTARALEVLSPARKLSARAQQTVRTVVHSGPKRLEHAFEAAVQHKVLPRRRWGWGRRGRRGRRRGRR